MIRAEFLSNVHNLTLSQNDEITRRSNTRQNQIDLAFSNIIESQFLNNQSGSEPQYHVMIIQNHDYVWIQNFRHPLPMLVTKEETERAKVRQVNITLSDRDIWSTYC